MVTKGKLKMALAAEKGVDYKKLKLKKKEKASLKKRNSKADREVKSPTTEEESHDEHEKNTQKKDKVKDKRHKNTIDSDSGEKNDCDRAESPEFDLAEINESDSDSSSCDNAEKNEYDEDIPVSDLDDLDDEEKEDLIPHQRLTINNTIALNAALKRISLQLEQLPFSEHQSVTTSKPVSIPDVSDDLNRELAFYSQCLSAAKEARKLLKAENVPFTRPNDYFAEMVKPDEHMEKIKAKLIEEAASKKASAEARKQRDLKKFGKQVQVAKLQEREKERKQTLEKIKVLKRKRQGATVDNANEADMFDVAVDEEIGKSTTLRGKRTGPSKRHKKDEKFGFGGKKRFKKSGDAISSGDLKGFSSKKMKASAKVRPGKARRAKKR